MLVRRFHRRRLGPALTLFGFLLFGGPVPLLAGHGGGDHAGCWPDGSGGAESVVAPLSGPAPGGGMPCMPGTCPLPPSACTMAGSGCLSTVSLPTGSSEGLPVDVLDVGPPAPEPPAAPDSSSLATPPPRR